MAPYFFNSKLNPTTKSQNTPNQPHCLKAMRTYSLWHKKIFAEDIKYRHEHCLIIIFSNKHNNSKMNICHEKRKHFYCHHPIRNLLGKKKFKYLSIIVKKKNSGVVMIMNNMSIACTWKMWAQRESEMEGKRERQKSRWELLLLLKSPYVSFAFLTIFNVPIHFQYTHLTLYLSLSLKAKPKCQTQKTHKKKIEGRERDI